MDEPNKRLNTLGLLYYILGALCIPAAFAAPAVLIRFIPSADPRSRLLLMLGAAAGAFGSLILVFFIFLTGYAIRRYRWWALCYVVAILLCPSLPLGTALGVYSGKRSYPSPLKNAKAVGLFPCGSRRTTPVFALSSQERAAWIPGEVRARDSVFRSRNVLHSPSKRGDRHG